MNKMTDKQRELIECMNEFCILVIGLYLMDIFKGGDRK